jgi:hypothetical protein
MESHDALFHVVSEAGSVAVARSVDCVERIRNAPHRTVPEDAPHVTLAAGLSEHPTAVGASPTVNPTLVDNVGCKCTRTDGASVEVAAGSIGQFSARIDASANVSEAATSTISRLPRHCAKALKYSGGAESAVRTFVLLPACSRSVADGVTAAVTLSEDELVINNDFVWPRLGVAVSVFVGVGGRVRVLVRVLVAAFVLVGVIDSVNVGVGVGGGVMVTVEDGTSVAVAVAAIVTVLDRDSVFDSESDRVTDVDDLGSEVLTENDFEIEPVTPAVNDAVAMSDAEVLVENDFEIEPVTSAVNDAVALPDADLDTELTNDAVGVGRTLRDLDSVSLRRTVTVPLTLGVTVSGLDKLAVESADVDLVPSEVSE